MKRLFFIATFTVFSPFVFSMELTVEDAKNLAVANNIEIKRGGVTLEGLKRSNAHSWNSISPSLSLSANASTSNKNFGDTWNTGWTASASISFAPNLFTTMKEAKLKYENGILTFDETKKSVSVAAEKAFYELLYEKENIDLQKRNLKALETTWKQAQERYKTGRVSEIDSLTAEVNYKAQIPSLESAEIEFQNDLAAFKQALGINLDEEIDLKGSLLEKSKELLEKNYNAENLNFENVASIKNLKSKLDQAKTNVAAARFSAYAPSISASWSYGESYSIPGKKSGDEGSLRFSASIPLDGVLPWSSKNDKIDSSKDSVKDLELQLENEYLTVKNKVESNLRNIHQIQASLKSQEATVELAKKTYEMTEEAYNMGKKSLTDLQNSQDSYLSKTVTMKKRIYDLISSILDLEKILNP